MNEKRLQPIIKNEKKKAFSSLSSNFVEYIGEKKERKKAKNKLKMIQNQNSHNKTAIKKPKRKKKKEILQRKTKKNQRYRNIHIK